MQSATQTRTSTAFRRIIGSQQWGIILVLIALITIMAIASPVFLSARNIRNVLQQISTLGILSMGMTVLMISGGIDLSVGACISVSAVTMGTMIKAGMPAELAILVGLLIGCAIGLLNGALAAYTRAHPFILTLGTMTLLQGLAIFITKGYPITDLGRRFEWIGGARLKTPVPGLELPVIVLLFFLVMIVCYVMLRYTRFGRLAYAIGGNEYTTFLSGIPVKRYKILFYVLCGFFAGLASVVLSSRISSALSTMGDVYTLQAIGAVVIGGVPLTGGRGSVWGTFTGVLLLGVIANGLNLLHLDYSIQYMLTGFIIIIAVIMHEHRQRR
jgi:ribose/xylose/arabinose/galactoside ABC-type transport system permease subunit